MHKIESKLLQLITYETDRVKSLSPFRSLHDDPHEWAERYGSIKA